MKEKEVDVADYIRLFLEHKYLILIIAFFGYLVSANKKKLFYNVFLIFLKN